MRPTFPTPANDGFYKLLQAGASHSTLPTRTNEQAFGKDETAIFAAAGRWEALTALSLHSPRSHCTLAALSLHSHALGPHRHTLTNFAGGSITALYCFVLARALHKQNRIQLESDYKVH